MPQFEPFTTVYKLKFLSEYRYAHCFRTCLQFLDFADFNCSIRKKLKDKMVH